MSIFDAEVNRIYKCSNCHGKISATQEVRDDFLTQCPLCEEKTLSIHSGTLSSQTVQSDSQKPKTFGMQGQINRDRAEREGTAKYKYGKVPWWRKQQGKKKIDYSILSNPSKYIMTGRKE
jgi:DNA-directed RNA polymerase subunit RPC12/RpoP